MGARGGGAACNEVLGDFPWGDGMFCLNCGSYIKVYTGFALSGEAWMSLMRPVGHTCAKETRRGKRGKGRGKPEYTCFY